MKRYINICIGLLLLLGAIGSSAQSVGRIEGGFNVDDFPNVSFIYHSHNPNELNRSDFWGLKEGADDLKFNFSKMPNAYTDVGEDQQATLILWEDMAHNGYGQFKFTQDVLCKFFRQANIPSAHKFAVAAFNRRKNAPSALINLTDGFTTDKSSVMRAVKNYKHSQEHYPEFPNRSDMYTAIREGMELLASVKGPKSIIVFTSGYSMKNSGSDSEAQVLLKAQQLHIPVYIFQYYYSFGVAPESEGFAKSTFGEFNSYKDVATAESALLKLYPKIGERYQGHNYKISFVSNAQRGTEARMITLSVGSAEIKEQLTPPPHTFVSWVCAHPWWTGLIAIILIVCIIAVILLVVKVLKNVAENRKELADLEQRRIQDKKAAEQDQRNFEEKVRQERAKRQQQADEERLRHIMAIKNMYPRLKCRVGRDTFTYVIEKPKTLVGREQDNDLILHDDKVSRHHAEIIFNGSSFEIVDKGSTNKVIVNGRFVESMILKSGDIIGLGEVVITFLY